MSGRDGGPVDQLRESKGIAIDEFEARVREEGEVVKEHIAEGTFDNDQVTVGLEYEFYAVGTESHELRRVPRDLLDCLGFEKELGLHNAELNAGVYPCNGPGLAALSKDVESKVASLQRRAAEEGVRFVSDGMWTIGPEYNTPDGYLTEATHEEGLTLAINVSNAVRYHGFATVPPEPGGRLEFPGATVEADSPGPVSLTTSIQPHYQCRRAADLPDHFRTAVRLAGPLLAVGVNSPFLPPELYDDADPDATVLLREGRAEKRVPVYEEMMNPADGPPKVRFPRDVDAPEEAVDRIVEDGVLVPAEIDAGERFDDAFVHFRHKHGSYWRWVRPVFGGATAADANVRIEFRPLPGQPTLPDAVAFVAAFVGLMTAFHEQDHPARELPWETARDNFYAAVREGLDADLAWVTADGERTTDTDRLYSDLFETSVEGLVSRGLGETEAAERVDPLRRRVDSRLTPAGWKRRSVAGHLENGATATEAIRRMQRSYIENQAATLRTGHLTGWPEP